MTRENGVKLQNTSQMQKLSFVNCNKLNHIEKWPTLIALYEMSMKMVASKRNVIPIHDTT